MRPPPNQPPQLRFRLVDLFGLVSLCAVLLGLSRLAPEIALFTLAWSVLICLAALPTIVAHAFALLAGVPVSGSRTKRVTRRVCISSFVVLCLISLLFVHAWDGLGIISMFSFLAIPIWTGQFIGLFPGDAPK